MHYKTLKSLQIKHKWPVKDWLVSHYMLDLAVTTILRKVKINRNYDIPYVAGYSQNGKSIYIDRDMPKYFKSKSRVIEIDRFLVLHEAVEKTLIEQLGLHYQLAHQIALRAEQAAVRADRVTWTEYDKFCQKYIKEIGDKKLKRVPRDLDTKPYRDEHDDLLLKHMKKEFKGVGAKGLKGLKK